MKMLSKFLALVVILFASTQWAHAGTIYGTLDAGAIKTPSSFTPLIYTSTFNGVTFGNFNFHAFTNTTAGGTLFTATAPNATLTYVVSSVSIQMPTPAFQSTTWTYIGTLTETVNGVTVSAPFTYTISNVVGSVYYSEYGINPTPEPNSLLLLGTGLVGAAAIVIRRRRTLQV